MIDSTYDSEWFFDSESEHKIVIHRIKRADCFDTDALPKSEDNRHIFLGEKSCLDNKIQSAESDEFVYHEALVHPAMVFQESQVMS